MESHLSTYLLKTALSLPVSTITVASYAHTILSARTTFVPHLYLLKSSSHHPSKFDSAAPLLKKRFKRVHPIYSWEVPFYVSSKRRKKGAPQPPLHLHRLLSSFRVVQSGTSGCSCEFLNPYIVWKICLHPWNFSGNCVCRRHWVALWYPSTWGQNQYKRDGQPEGPERHRAKVFIRLCLEPFLPLDIFYSGSILG